MSSLPAAEVGWGIIGCGDVVARKAAAGLLATPGHRIVSAMRRTATELEAFGQRFGVGHLTTDAAELLARADVDMVYIATPPDLHLHYARLAAAAGKGVLIEKPCGRCAAETQAIAVACGDAGVPVFASYYRRYLPKFQTVRALLAAGAIGPVVAVSYRFRERGGAAGWRESPVRSGGGSFYDLACHVLDLIDLLFGPLHCVAGDARNLRAELMTEDLVMLQWQGHAVDGGTVHGTASWNFASTEKVDELVIEGQRGRIRCQAMKLFGDVRVEVDRTLDDTDKGSLGTRLRKQLRNRLWSVRAETIAHPRPLHSHAPLFASIGAAIADGSAVDGKHFTAALHTARLMDAALTGYYGGREIGFWDHPERWQSLRARVRVDRARVPPAQRAALAADITDAVRGQFERDGWVGPFDADIPGLASTFVPQKERKDLHLTDPQIFSICTHPAIIERVAALVGTTALSIFKTRVHTKAAETSKTAPKHAVVPWHQDAGVDNGGHDLAGNAIPTWTVWLALDDVGADSGPVCVLPGTQNKLYGNYDENFDARLVERGHLTQQDVDRAVPLLMRRGQFCVFHSWLLHASAPNNTKVRRAGLNIRFVRDRDRVAAEYDYVELEPWPGDASAPAVQAAPVAAEPAAAARLQSVAATLGRQR